MESMGSSQPVVEVSYLDVLEPFLAEFAAQSGVNARLVGSEMWTAGSSQWCGTSLSSTEKVDDVL